MNGPDILKTSSFRGFPLIDEETYFSLVKSFAETVEEDRASLRPGIQKEGSYTKEVNQDFYCYGKVKLREPL